MNAATDRAAKGRGRIRTLVEMWLGRAGVDWGGQLGVVANVSDNNTRDSANRTHIAGHNSGCTFDSTRRELGSRSSP